MSVCFFTEILNQAERWQVHIPSADAFGHMVLRPVADGAGVPSGAGLLCSEWSGKARAFNCEVDGLYLINNFIKTIQYSDKEKKINKNKEENFLALRLLSMAEQTHPMPDAVYITLRAFQLFWAFRSPAVERKREVYIHAFLSDLRAFTEDNLHLRARHSAMPHEKSPIQKGESCAIVAENMLLTLHFINAHL